VTPRRGALAFWYDLDAKGYRMPSTIHGGCPVLKGSKWILNKWVYYFNQVSIL
jgi:prolyl 4-hydroxylase